jgi:hypothetical protein
MDTTTDIKKATLAHNAKNMSVGLCDIVIQFKSM